MYKVKNGLAPENVSALFVRKRSTHLLRNSDFVLRRFDTKRYGKHCIRYLGPLLWTKLSKDLKNSPTVATFRTKIRLTLSDYIENNSNCCKLCSALEILQILVYFFLSILNDIRLIENTVSISF